MAMFCKKISHSLELLISWVQVIGVSHLQLCLIFSACSCSRLALISRSVWLHGNTAANPGLSRVAHAGVKIVMWYLFTTLSHARDFWARFSTSIQNPVSFHKTALKTADCYTKTLLSANLMHTNLNSIFLFPSLLPHLFINNEHV